MYLEIFNAWNHILFTMSASGLLLKYSSNFANCNILIKYIVMKRKSVLQKPKRPWESSISNKQKKRRAKFVLHNNYFVLSGLIIWQITVKIDKLCLDEYDLVQENEMKLFMSKPKILLKPMWYNSFSLSRSSLDSIKHDNWLHVSSDEIALQSAKS